MTSNGNSNDDPTSNVNPNDDTVLDLPVVDAGTRTEPTLTDLRAVTGGNPQSHFFSSGMALLLVEMVGRRRQEPAESLNLDRQLGRVVETATICRILLTIRLTDMDQQAIHDEAVGVIIGGLHHLQHVASVAERRIIHVTTALLARREGADTPAWVSGEIVGPFITPENWEREVEKQTGGHMPITAAYNNITAEHTTVIAPTPTRE